MGYVCDRSIQEWGFGEIPGATNANGATATRRPQAPTLN